MPKISIIVPVYNVEDYIDRCIKSILSQSLIDFELILVDDGSTDKSGEICDLYAAKDDRIKVIHKKNGGLSDARNNGLDIATAEYIGFVDSDDFIEKDMYEKLYNACRDYDVSLSISGRYRISNDKSVVMFNFQGIQIWSSEIAIGNLLVWNGIDSAACDKLFKRCLFEQLRFPVGKYNEDVFIMTKIIHKSREIVHIGAPKYYYCQRAKSITTEEFSEKKMDLLEANQEVVDLVNSEYSELKQKAESFQFKGIIYLYGLLQSIESRKKFKKEYFLLKELISKNIFAIIRNPYIKKRIKIKSILMITRLYLPIKNFQNKYEQFIS